MTDPVDHPTPPQNAAGASTSYRVLARKYRPSNFDELIGQDSLVQTLSNALKMGRLAHAFVLTGLRGIGKTTTARIIARGLNCTGADGQGQPTLSPCGVCSSCTGIAEGRHVDVIEMDAASNTGVDDVREIIDGVGYRPLSARYKIYIIDEVHMLSKNAFNALLKTLEEPPEAVKFIFATTEIRKVPVTVLSRCQRFDLRRVPNAMMAAHLKSICAKENITAEEAALDRLARGAEGSVRDALSLLDQAAALTADQVTDDAVAVMMGQAGRGQSLDMVNLALSGDAGGAMERLQQAVGRGAEPLMVINDMLDLIHMATRLAAGGHLDDAPEGEREQLTRLAETSGVAKLGRAWQIALKGHGEVQSSPNPHAVADMLLIRLAHVAPMPTPAELVRKLEQNPPSTSSPQRSAPAQPAPSAPPASSSAPLSASDDLGDSDPDPHPVSEAAGLKDAPAMDAGSENWDQANHSIESPEPNRPISQDPIPQDMREMVRLFEDQGEMILANLIRFHLRPVVFEPGRFEYDQDSDVDARAIADIARHLQDWTGLRWIISPANGGGKTLDEQDRERHQAEVDQVSANPLVAAVLNGFPGATVAAVTPIESLGASDTDDDGPDDDATDHDATDHDQGESHYA